MKILKIIAGILAALVLIFLLAGLVRPQVTYQTEVRINRPLEETFTLFNDIEQVNKWIPQVESVNTIKKTPEIVGSIHKMKVSNQGNVMEMTETVTEYIENEKVSLDFAAGEMHKVDHIYFSSQGDQTIIRSDHMCEGTSYFHKCMFAFFGSMFKQIDQTSLDNFKDFAEKSL